MFGHVPVSRRSGQESTSASRRPECPLWVRSGHSPIVNTGGCCGCSDTNVCWWARQKPHSTDRGVLSMTYGEPRGKYQHPYRHLRGTASVGSWADRARIGLAHFSKPSFMAMTTRSVPSQTQHCRPPAAAVHLGHYHLAALNVPRPMVQDKQLQVPYPPWRDTGE